MRTRWFFSTAAILILAAGIVRPSLARDGKRPVIRRLPVEKNEPLAITDVKVDGRSVSLNEEFFASENWIRTLAISVKNISDKPILYSSVGMVFPRPPNSEDSPLRYSVGHGNDELMIRQRREFEQLDEMMPGSIVEITFSDSDFSDLRQRLKEMGYPSVVENVSLRIGHVIFEDDTMWSTGFVPHRSPNTPGLWVR